MTKRDGDLRDRLAGLGRAWWARMASRVVTGLPSSTRVLHVGAEEPALVEELLALGIDAHGFQRTLPVTPSPVAAERFASGCLGDAGYRERSFATILWSLSSEDAEAAVRKLLPALTRLCDRHAVLMFHGTDAHAIPADSRRRIRSLLLDSGFRTHPMDFRFRTYDPRDDDPRTLSLAFERIPHIASRDRTAAGEDEHTSRAVDWLLDPHPRADDAAARYALAAQWIARHDVVVDVAAGAGSGAATLYDGSFCSQLLAIDGREQLISYARRAFGGHRPHLEFVHGPGTHLTASIGDRAVDVLVALDPRWTAVHGGAVVEQAAQTLLPGGRLIIAIPGHDREPSCTTETMMRRLDERFYIERVYAQMTSGPGPHCLVDLTNPDVMRRFDADCWIVVALADPLAPGDAPWNKRPDQFDHPRTRDASLNIGEVSEGYVNPWTPYGVVLGSRVTSPDLLVEFALRTLDEHPGYSADRGAALCVLAYRRLEDHEPAAMRRAPLETWLTDFVAETPRTGVEIRWSISNSYVLGRLLLRSGRLEAAESMFARCASLAASAHEASATTGPAYLGLTATKTVDAAFRAGWLAARRGDREQARERWQSGIATARHVVMDDWDRFTGPRVISTPYAIREASQVLAAAERCEHGLAWLDGRDDRIAGDFAVFGLSISINGEAPSLYVPADTFGGRARGGPLATWVLGGMSDRPIYLWGAGAMGRNFASVVGRSFACVAGFIDNDPAKQGTQVLGKPVYPSSRLEPCANQAVRPFVFVTSAFAHEILPALACLGYTVPADVFDFSALAEHAQTQEVC